MMTVDREKAYLEIIERGVLNIRTLLARGDVGQAAVEANHIHNLPALLRGEQGQSEDVYWDVARTGYLRDSKPGWPSAFRDMWESLEPKNASASAGARASYYPRNANWSLT